MAITLKCFVLALYCTFAATHSQEEDNFLMDEFQGYPTFREDEIRGRRTTANVLRAANAGDNEGSNVGRSDTHSDSISRKSDIPFSNEQLEKTLSEAFRTDPFADDDSDATVRNNVHRESLIAKHGTDGSIPLSIIENERHGNPYQRDIVENELVESPFSDMDTGMNKGRKFRHKVV